MTAGARQLPLPLHWKAARGQKDFFVSGTNRDAVRFLDEWSNWPVPAGLLVGPAASGKTHLADIFRRRAGAVVLDDADYMHDEEGLFHAWNRALQTGRPLLMTARSAPADWGIGLADLRSRLFATPQVAIGRPDDALLAAIIAKLWRDRGVEVDRRLVDYMLQRVERSFAAVEAVVTDLDRRALATGRRPSLPLLREVLEAD